MADLARPVPMHRLLQGEVGSGKTVVALRAMLAVVDSGGQAVLLAPTEVLAQQHARSIDALLGPLGRQGELGAADVATAIALVTGSMSAPARRRALLDIGVGDAGIVIGTHALLENTVQFFDLGLVVVDEQHRFGVEQRDALRTKAATPPHVLVMTATPIPRTVAMTVYGDLETSTLTELPAGRQPITTTVVPTADKPGWLDRVWQRAREEVEAGRQVYVVCPADRRRQPRGRRVATSAGSDPWAGAASVEDYAPMLAAGPLAGLRVEVLHGRLAPDVKDDVMRRFAAGAIDVLVATTVIEVGVDVANATVMVVLDAERFGISQLHQLRGRIGRGAHPGVCLLVTAAEAGTRGPRAARRRRRDHRRVRARPARPRATARGRRPRRLAVRPPVPAEAAAAAARRGRHRHGPRGRARRWSRPTRCSSDHPALRGSRRGAVRRTSAPTTWRRREPGHCRRRRRPAARHAGRSRPPGRLPSGPARGCSRR